MAQQNRRRPLHRDRFISVAARMIHAVDRRSRCVIVSLHRVGGDSGLTEEQLARHLDYLRRRFRVLLPSQLLEERRPRKQSAIITADDCHECFHSAVFPVARALGIPVAVCVPTDFVLRGRWLWFDRLAWSLMQASKPTDVSSDHLKRLTPAERDALIEQTIATLGVTLPAAPPPAWQPTTVAQLREMLATGLLEICSHTVTHPILTGVNDSQLADELQRSKAELESTFGQKVTAFCYPNGEIGDFDDRTTRAVRAAGYKMAFTSVEGVNRLRTADWFRLRRVHAHPRQAVFEKLASGLGDLQHGLRRACRTAMVKGATS